MNCLSCIVVIGVGGHLATGLKVETSYLKWFESYGLETLKKIMLFDVCDLDFDLMTLVLKVNPRCHSDLLTCHK